MSSILLIAVAACSDDGRPVNIPVVAAGEYEADCQRLCTRAPGDEHCSAKHAEYCLASCRARTNGLPSACATCMIAAGSVIHGDIDGFDEPFCSVGGPSSISTCATQCDDGGAMSSATIAVQCDLECKFYMSDTTALACSAEGSADCLAGCTAALAVNGRVCSQCLIDGVLHSRICINNNCDCEPFFDSDPGFGCEELCDAVPPA